MKQSTKIENEFIKNRWTLDVIEKEKKLLVSFVTS